MVVSMDSLFIGGTYLLTLFPEVVGLLVDHSRWPPLRLGLLRVSLLTRGSSSSGLASIVRMLHLLPRFNEFNKSFGNLAAIKLLEMLQGILVVLEDFLSVPDLNAYHACGGRYFLNRLREMWLKSMLLEGRLASLYMAREVVGTRVAI